MVHPRAKDHQLQHQPVKYFALWFGHLGARGSQETQCLELQSCPPTEQILA